MGADHAVCVVVSVVGVRFVEPGTSVPHHVHSSCGHSLGVGALGDVRVVVLDDDEVVPCVERCVCGVVLRHLQCVFSGRVSCERVHRDDDVVACLGDGADLVGAVHVAGRVVMRRWCSLRVYLGPSVHGNDVVSDVGPVVGGDVVLDDIVVGGHCGQHAALYPSRHVCAPSGA